MILLMVFSSTYSWDHHMIPQLVKKTILLIFSIPSFVKLSLFNRVKQNIKICSFIPLNSFSYFQKNDTNIWGQLEDQLGTSCNRFGPLHCRAGIFKKSMGARNRVGIGLLYRPARLHRLAEFIPWNRFLSSINV